MDINIRELMKVACSCANLSPGDHPSGEEIATIRERINQATGLRLQNAEVEILFMAEQIMDRYK